MTGAVCAGTVLWSSIASVTPTVAAAPSDNPAAMLATAANENPAIAGSSLPGKMGCWPIYR